MNILRIVLTVIFVIDCIGLTVVVLMQEGKQKGLGAISGMADTYWGQNKGRSMEGHLVLAHKDHGDSVYGTGNRIEYEILSDVKRTLLQLSCKGVFCTQREAISNDYIYNGRPFVTAKTVNSYKC